MAIKITKKIKSYSVNKPEEQEAVAAAQPVAAASPQLAEIIQMHEKVERPEYLVGATYKIKSPLVEHAMYVTINDIVLNHGTNHEMRRPFEVFINSKNMDHFQWVVAITRIMSAVFRKGGDVTFLVEEMKAVFDPRGGYFKAGGVYMPSIVAEIGSVVEEHLKLIGMIVDPETERRAARADCRETRGLREPRQKKSPEGDLAVDAGRTGADEAASESGEGASFPPPPACATSATTRRWC